MMATLRGWIFLVLYSLRRQLWSKKVVIAFALVALPAVVLRLAALREPIDPEIFAAVVIYGVFGPFIFPMVMLSFGNGALGDDREERTLVYLLTRPLARWGIYFGKFLSVLPIALALGIGGLWALCRIGDQPGQHELADIFQSAAPAYCFGALAYLACFHLIGVIFRHATLVSIVYVFFIEVFIGQVPGILKRVSISFFTTSMAHGAGGALSLDESKRFLFQPVDPEIARAVLVGITAAALVIGAIAFSRSETRETP